MVKDVMDVALEFLEDRSLIALQGLKLYLK